MTAPEFSNPDPILRTPTPTGTARLVFDAPDAHGDDLQAAGDERRDQWTPDPKDIA